MVGCGRNFIPCCTAFFIFWCRALLAPSAASEQTTCQGFHPRSPSWTARRTEKEEAEKCNPLTVWTSRFANTEVFDNELLGMSLPCQGLREPSQQAMVRQLWPTLCHSEVVGSQEQCGPVSEQTEEKGEERQEIRRSPKQRPPGTFWKEGDGGEARSGKWDAMGDFDTYQSGSIQDAELSRNYGFSFAGQGQQEEELGRTRRCLAEAGSNEREVEGERDCRRRIVSQPAGSRIGCARTSPDTKADTQSCDTAAKGRTQQRGCERPNQGARCEMEGMARVHDAKTSRTTWPLHGQKENHDGEIHGSSWQNRRAQGGDQIGRCYHGSRKGRRRSRVLKLLDAGRFRGGKDRPDRNERRRGSRSNSCRREAGSQRGKEETEYPDCSFSVQSGKNSVVSFSEEVEIVIYDNEDDKRHLTFSTVHEGLNEWPSKPWSLHPGYYTHMAMINYSNHGFLGGFRDGDDWGFHRNYDTAELFDILDHGVCHGDVLCRDLLQGDGATIRTFGLRNQPIGEISMEVKQEEWDSNFTPLHSIAKLIVDGWNVDHKEWTRLHLVPHRSHRQGDKNDIAVIVEHWGWSTAMANVPVLFTHLFTVGADKFEEAFAAYVDHVMTFEDFVEWSGLSDLKGSMCTNRCCIWINNEIVIPGLFYLVLPGDNISIAYFDEGEPVEGNEDAPDSKRARHGASSSTDGVPPPANNPEPADEDPAGSTPTSEGDEDDDNDFDSRVRAHLFHHCTDYTFDRLDAPDPIGRHRQAALAWNIPMVDVVGLHPVRNPPQDLVGREVVITRWTSDVNHREWPDDVLILLDLVIEDQGGAVIRRRTVRWTKPANTRLGLLRWARVESYCRREARQPCRIWYNNYEWDQTDMRIQRFGMGDYVKILLPTQDGRTLLDSDRRLRQLERLCRFEYFFDSPNNDDGAEGEESEETVDGSTSTCSRRTVEEPEPHDVTPAQVVLLSDALNEASSFQPVRQPDLRDCSQSGLDFGEVWRLLEWLDAATISPSWLLPEGREWHSATEPWIDNEWWSLQTPLELWFYTDGSCTPNGAGSAVVLFVKSAFGWHYGGYVAQKCHKQCAHFAELQALVMGFHWLHGLLTFCAVMGLPPPLVTFAFDATSAGYKAFGFWGGQQYQHETANIRSIWQWIVSKFNFHWTTNHTAAHQGDPGNEAANSAAQAAAWSTNDLRSFSTWGHYVMLTRDIELHWLWACWKKEWKDYWKGTTLHLPVRPDTAPSPVVLGLCEQTADVSTAGCEPTELKCCFATANVLTLMPGPKKHQEHGVQGRTRTEYLQRLFTENQVHVVGLQETRMRKTAKTVADDYFVFSGCATSRGHFGTQLWFSRVLPLDKEGNCYFQKEHFKIIHQDPRSLCVRVLAPFAKMIVISGHAPHSQASEDDKARWWNGLCNITPARYKDWPHFVLFDANARVGEYSNELIGDFEADSHDANGTYFCDYVAQCGLWLPSTFENIHSGDSGTWWHQQGQKWLRGDFVCLPTQIPFTFCESKILDNIDLSLLKDDHRPVSATIKWQAVNNKVEKPAAWTQTKFDSHAIKNVLSGPNGLQQLHALREFVPICDWSVDVHSHMAWLQHGLRSWAKQTCKAEGPKPHKKTLSEETWQLILQKREIRKQHFASKKHFDRLKLACLFKRWRGARVEWPHETKEESHAAALNLAKFIVLGKQVTQAVRADDKRYFEELTASMGHPLDTHVGPDTWKKIRWALPKLQQKRKQSPTLLEELDSQWLKHFSELEAGHEIEINGLVDKCHSRQLTRPHARQLQLSDLPTLGEVEATLRATQPHRAPGPDCLPGSLFRYGATSIAVGVHDVYAKTIAWEAEAVQNKGGIMVPIHKAGPYGQACNYRGIMLLNTLAKGLHAIMRRRIMEHLEPVRLTSQLGGFQFQQAQFGAQCVQTLARVCAARGLSHCTLFVDVKGAYHYLIRELVLGIESHEDFDEVLKHLTKQKIDNKGVKLWSGLPGLLERIHADPKLISTLRELHCDTWASLPQGTMRSRRGSRPGSPIADAIFHALMLDIHIEVHRVIEDDTEACQGFKFAELPVCAVTWADDLAVPLIAETATDLVPLVQRITRKLILTFEQRGLTLNLARNKTAAVLSFKGPHATTMRREHLLKSAPGCQIKVNENRCEWLHFTGTYKHLGSIFCADGDMKREITSRIGAASRTFSTLRKNIFNNKQLAVRVRLQLLDALVLSQLFYGISTWSALGAGLVEKVDSFVLNCQRLICGVDRATTHDAFRGIYQLPRTDTRLAASRLLYAAKAWTHGPDILRQLLAKEDEVCDASWLGALRLDLTWCADIAGDRIPQEWSLDDVDVLAPLWRDHPRKWNVLVKKMYKSSILQEAIAAEARGWHHLILADLQSTGGEVVGAPGKPPDGTHRCHCGKMCKSAQGLSAHKWQVHQERAPESKFLESPCCPVCMRWFWTTHRLRMHLSYIPRNGQANPCFRALSCSTFRANTQEEGEAYAVPQELKGMRLDSLACEGPMKPLLRRVDGELDEVNDEIKDMEEKLADYPSEEDIDIALVEKVSCAFSECTRQTLQEGGQTDDLINRWAACLGDLWTDEDEAAIEVVFTAWGKEVMHDIALSADDCFGGAYADEAFYETVKDLDYPRLVTRYQQLQARLRHLQQIRLDEDQAPPHRAVRQGPRFRRGGNKKLQGALRLYADGDGWDKACHAMDWHKAPPERYMPMYRTPEGRRCFIILHLFAGRRRAGDYHDELARLSSAEDFDLRVLSFDTAINAKLGDLSATSQSWKNIDTLLRKGYVAGAMAGSPCETFTEARYYIPEDVEEKDRKRWPRPLRDTASPWGREFLTHREMRQLKVGSAFALQVVWTFAMLLIYGGHMFVEHPAPPKALDRASIFRLPIVALLLKLPETRLRIILQKDWGATSVKPTGFLVLRAPSFITSMRRWMSPSATTSPAIGKENGTFKTAALKEYPKALSKGLAQSTIDAVKLKIRRGQLRSFDVNEFPPGLGSWCEEVVNAVSTTSCMMPDYQGAAKVF